MQINFDDILFAAEYATENIIADLEPVHIKLLQFDNKYVIINT